MRELTFQLAAERRFIARSHQTIRRLRAQLYRCECGAETAVLVDGECVGCYQARTGKVGPVLLGEES